MTPRKLDHSLSPLRNEVTGIVLNWVQPLLHTGRYSWKYTVELDSVKGTTDIIFVAVVEIDNLIHISIMVDGHLANAGIVNHFSMTYQPKTQQIVQFFSKGVPIREDELEKVKYLIEKIEICMQK